jgi:hypothetical protein
MLFRAPNYRNKGTEYSMPIGLTSAIFPARTGEWQERNMTGALDRSSQGALMASAIACLAAGADFAFIGNKALEHIHFFVVNAQTFVSAELTGFRAGKIPAFAGCALRLCAVIVSFIRHFLLHVF